MKRSMLLLAALGMAVSGLAQDAVFLRQGSDISKAITNVSLTTSSEYVAGQTNLIQFNLNFSSPDFEYLDGFEITFPVGVTPLEEGSSAVIGDIESEIEINLPVTGQSISWGVIPGGTQWGELFPGPYTFDVSVNVDASFTGSILASYTLHGDTYGSEPHLVSGTVIILAVGSPRLPHSPNPPNFAVNVGLSGTLSWNFGSSSDTYDLWFGESGNMQQVVQGATAGSSGSYSYADLAGATTYKWQVLVHNSSKALTTGPVWQFSTISSAISSFPYFQNFDGPWSGDPAAPADWAVINADGDAFTWTQSNAYIDPTPSEPYAAHGMGNQDDWLISPPIDLSETFAIIKWMDMVESETRNNSYKVLVSTTSPTMEAFTDELADIDCSNTEWVEHTLSLGNYNGQTIFIAFYQYYSASPNWGFGIDDFVVEAITECAVPSELSADNLTFNSADLHWAASGIEVGWNLEWGQGSFSPGAGTLVEGIENNFYELSGLAAETTYAFYVQSICGEGFTSDWAGPLSFETAEFPIEVTCPQDMEVCESDAAFALSGASPEGGNYSGTGVTAGQFNPAVAGPGTHPITYTLGEHTCEFGITVNETPEVTWVWDQTSVCIQVASLPLTGGLPEGGVYSGPGVDGIQFIPQNAGAGTHTLTYTFTSAEGCPESAQVQIVVDECTGTPVVSLMNQIKVYPNPASNKLFIEFARAREGMLQLVIYDLLGNEVLTFEETDPGQNIALDVSSLRAGIYFLRVIGTQVNFSRKILIN
ncbi:MAG: choice-of-anchor J domain-containing protein [Bacteroidales bacterium]|nr:choice-of-anchor J domain-containing protein [Bacteroidales bacterium]